MEISYTPGIIIRWNSLPLPLYVNENNMDHWVTMALLHMGLEPVSWEFQHGAPSQEEWLHCPACPVHWSVNTLISRKLRAQGLYKPRLIHLHLFLPPTTSRLFSQLSPLWDAESETQLFRHFENKLSLSIASPFCNVFLQSMKFCSFMGKKKIKCALKAKISSLLGSTTIQDSNTIN